MDDNLAVLIEQAQADIAELTRGLMAGDITTAVWRDELADTLATYHTAAYMLAADVDDIDAATRAALEKTIDGQIGYLDAFAETINPSEWSDGIESRAASYGQALKGSWWQGAVGDFDAPAYPGDGSTACLGNCGCSWEMRDDGAFWVRGKSDSCADCVQREQDWAPYQGASE